MRDRFVRELRVMLGVEDRDDRVESLRRVFTLVGEPDVPLESRLLAELGTGDASVLRVAAVKAASYAFLVHLAQALHLDGEAVRLLRALMEEDAYAYEQAEHTLAQRLAETYEPKIPTL
jgi:hypothetical protein